MIHLRRDNVARGVSIPGRARRSLITQRSTKPPALWREDNHGRYTRSEHTHPADEQFGQGEGIEGRIRAHGRAAQPAEPGRAVLSRLLGGPGGTQDDREPARLLETVR